MDKIKFAIQRLLEKATAEFFAKSGFKIGAQIELIAQA